MTKKDYRKRSEFIRGYRQGYQSMYTRQREKTLMKNDYFRAGYYEARRDRKDGEQPLY